MKQRSNKQFSINSFPRVRMRRNRLSEFSRKLISENNLSINDLIYPIFITAKRVYFIRRNFNFIWKFYWNISIA